MKLDWDQQQAANRLYETAEGAAKTGLTLLRAVQAVADGYSSAEFDKRYRDGEYE